MSKRRNGSGSLLIRTNRHGREVFHGQWRSNGRLVKRRLGLKRVGSSGPGMLTAPAEKALRDLIATVSVPVESMDLAEAARRWLVDAALVSERIGSLADHPVEVASVGRPRRQLEPVALRADALCRDPRRLPSARRTR